MSYSQRLCTFKNNTYVTRNYLKTKLNKDKRIYINKIFKILFLNTMLNICNKSKK